MLSRELALYSHDTYVGRVHVVCTNGRMGSNLVVHAASDPRAFMLS